MSATGTTGTTPFPNVLLDEIMPRLKDTEWRLLCVIVRQTRGWRDKSRQGRKERDWLSQTQLVNRTGRDRAALSQAIDVLVRNRIIEVQNEKGRCLESPSERRQCKGRLFFGLHPRLATSSPHAPLTPKSEYQMPGSNSLLSVGVSKSEFHSAPKANTTKETGTKENDTKRILQKSLKSLSRDVFVEKNSPSSQAAPITLPYAGQEYSNAVREFIVLFKKLHPQRQGQNAVITLSLEEAERLEELCAAYSPLVWTPVLQAFFAATSGYIVRRKHSLPAFLNSCHIFLIKRGVPDAGSERGLQPIRKL